MHVVDAWTAYFSGDTNTAVAESDAAVVWARQSRNPSALGFALGTWARVVADARPEEALDAAEESKRLTDATGGGVTYSAALQTIALLSARHGDLDRAARAVHEAMTWEVDYGNRPTVASDVIFALLVLARDPSFADAAAVIGGALGADLSALVTGFRQEGPLEALIRDAIESASQTLDEATFRAATARGAAMTYDESVSYVLSELNRIIEHLARR